MSSPAHSGSAPACIPNIDAAGRRQRRTLGIAMLAVGAAAAGWLLARGAAPAAGVPLVVPFALGLLGVLQARAQTCVRLAARGLRAGSDGAITALPTELDAQVRRQASDVLWRAALGGVGLTALVVLLAVFVRTRS